MQMDDVRAFCSQQSRFKVASGFPVHITLSYRRHAPPVARRPATRDSKMVNSWGEPGLQAGRPTTPSHGSHSNTRRAEKTVGACSTGGCLQRALLLLGGERGEKQLQRLLERHWQVQGQEEGAVMELFVTAGLFCIGITAFALRVHGGSTLWWKHAHMARRSFIAR
jgi:hypothetical protein